MTRGFLAIENETAARLEALLAAAGKLRPIYESGRASWALTGRTAVLAFFENSTRTRSAFTRAAALVGMNTLPFDASHSSTKKGETLRDTVNNLAAMRPALFVVRHPSADAPARVMGWTDLPTVNAGDGAHEHPTQALLDAYCLQREFGKLDGLKVVICGDLRHSRVARSNLHLLTKLGAAVTLVAPPTLNFDPGFELPVGAAATEDFDGAIREADAVMMLRIQNERMEGPFLPPGGEYRNRWGLTEARAATLKPGAIVMHPGPMNRGIEIDSAVADGPRSRILKQVEGGVLCRAALFLDLLGVPVDEAIKKVVG